MKSIIKYALYSIFFFTSFLISSCSKDDSNPVGSNVNVNINGSMYAKTPGGGLNVSTILKVDLLFDGNIIASANYADAVGTVNNLNGTVSTAKGTHTVAFRITNQTSSPNWYRVYDAIVTAGNSTYQLESKGADLKTGESISYSVTVD